MRKEKMIEYILAATIVFYVLAMILASHNVIKLLQHVKIYSSSRSDTNTKRLDDFSVSRDSRGLIVGWKSRGVERKLFIKDRPTERPRVARQAQDSLCSGGCRICEYLGEGFWPYLANFTIYKNDRIPKAVYQSYERGGVPDMGVRKYFKCTRAQNGAYRRTMYSCATDINKSHYYIGGGECYEPTDDNTAKCLDKWPGYVFFHGDSVVECATPVRLESGIIQNYTLTKHPVVSNTLVHNKTATKCHGRDVYYDNDLCADPNCLDIEQSGDLSKTADSLNHVSKRYDIDTVTSSLDHVNLTLYPGRVKSCDPNSRQLVISSIFESPRERTRHEELTYNELALEYIAPEYIYVPGLKGPEKRYIHSYIECRSLFSKNKIRVTHKQYGSLMEFFAYSLHVHTDNSPNDGSWPPPICVRPDCVPEPLTDNELQKIRQLALCEPVYTCSWTNKQLLYKWNVSTEIFEPHSMFDKAIGVYMDTALKADRTKTVIFGFTKSIHPVVNSSGYEYFDSLNNLGGYSFWWNEGEDKPTRPLTDTRRLSERLMNLVRVPDNFLLCEAAIVSVESYTIPAVIY